MAIGEANRMELEAQEPLTASGEEGESSPSRGCAVCLEALAGDRVALPCACKVDYCRGCWEQALAASLRGCGVPRCPTCRSVIRSELREPGEDHAERLSYSLAAVEAPGVVEENLSRQARTKQMQLLRHFGNYLRSRQPGDPKSERPPCACGAELRCTDAQARTQSSVSSEIICDICQRAIRSGPVWACQRGEGTIVHPFAQDICGACFERHMDAGRCAPSDAWIHKDDFGGTVEEEMHLFPQADALRGEEFDDWRDDFKYEDDFGGSTYRASNDSPDESTTERFGILGLGIFGF